MKAALDVRSNCESVTVTLLTSMCGVNLPADTRRALADQSHKTPNKETKNDFPDFRIQHLRLVP